MNRTTRVLKELLLPLGVFAAVLAFHDLCLGLFPEQDPAQARWAALPSEGAASPAHLPPGRAEYQLIMLRQARIVGRSLEEGMDELGVEATADQESHWSKVYTENEAFFGEGPSQFARTALGRFRQEGVKDVLELGCGQGRDTLFFAESGFQVTAIDYSKAAVDHVAAKAGEAGLSQRVTVQAHDLRKPLPFPDESFDACFSHMLLCMELRAYP